MTAQRLGIKASTVVRLLDVAFDDDALVLDAGPGRLLEVAFVDDPLVLESEAGRHRPGAKQVRPVVGGKKQGMGMVRLQVVGKKRKFLKFPFFYMEK
jgi:hypothetical protein